MRSLALVLIGCLSGCATSAPAWTTREGREAIFARHRNEEWTHVATCSGTDWLTLGHVENVLLSEGIPSASEGSVLYGLQVPRSDAERARAVLVEHQRPGVYTCWPTEAQGEPTASVFLGWVKPAAGLVTEYGAPVADVLRQRSLDARVAAALREDHVVDLLAALPVLDRVELWERPYLGDDGKWRRGAYLELRLVNAPGGAPGDFRLDYEVWDGESRSPHGGSAMFQGGSGSGPALVER